MQREIINNINIINDKIKESCLLVKQNVNEITLVAVSKKKSHELIEIALNNGIKNFGENYAQELREKSSLIKSKKIIWHFIGPIQSNKLKIIANHADWVHSLEREKTIKKLDIECKKINKTINACLQVNISNEKSKSGCNPNDLIDLANLVESMENINLKGIMALPDITLIKEERDKSMKKVVDLSSKLKSFYPRADRISLGTTSDYQDAIIHGSNILRIGESIFGKRI